MKKQYTIEDLKTINDDELFEITKAVVENKVKFSDKELQILCVKMNLYVQVLKDLDEYYKMYNIAGHHIFPEEYKALKAAYMAKANEDWPACKSALKVFLEWMDAGEDILKYDLSLWSYQHLLRWFSMLTMTELDHDAPEGSTIYTFSCMINEQVISRMPKHLKAKLWEGVQEFLPELAALFGKSNTVNEDAMKCVDLSEVAKALEMSEGDVLKTFEGFKHGEYLISKDKVIEIQ